MYELINKDDMEIYHDIGQNKKYVFNNTYVPRTTEILNSMLHDDYLMGWSNAMGLYRRKKYEDIIIQSSNIGTYTHNLIENFIKNHSIIDKNIIPMGIYDEVNNAFSSFLSWWEYINKYHKVEVVYSEEELVCEYFGGTLDLLIKIDGIPYLVDFKTSNHLSYKYFLQLSSYRYILREKRNIDVKGCIVLMLNKKSVSYNEYILRFDNLVDKDYMDRCEQCFLSLVQAYIQRLYIENYFNNHFISNK